MKKAVALLSTIIPMAALAHEGHGMVADPVLHQLFEPVHLAPLAVGVLLLWVARRRKRRS